MRSILLAILFFVFPIVSLAQPAPLEDVLEGTDKTWQTPEGEVQLYVTTEGDSAYVMQGHFRAHMSDDDIWVYCDGTVPEPFRVQDLVAHADTMLRTHSDYGINGDFMLRAECVTTVASVEDSVRSNN